MIALLLLLSGDVELNPGPDLNTNDDLGALPLIHLNIRSIRHKLDYIFETLSDYDILCFTESHLDDQVTDAYLISGCSNYTLYRRDLTAHSGGLLCIFLTVCFVDVDLTSSYHQCSPSGSK